MAGPTLAKKHKVSKNFRSGFPKMSKTWLKSCLTDSSCGHQFRAPGSEDPKSNSTERWLETMNNERLHILNLVYVLRLESCKCQLWPIAFVLGFVFLVSIRNHSMYMKLSKYSEIWFVSQVNYLKVQAAVSGISQAKDCKLGSSKPAHRQVLQFSEWMKQISKSLCHLKDYRQKMTKEPTCASSSSPPVDCSFNQVCLEFARNSPKPPAETTRMTSEGAGRLGSNPPQPTCGAAAQPSCDLLIRQLFTVEIIQWRHLRFQPTGPHVLRKKKKKTPSGSGNGEKSLAVFQSFEAKKCHPTFSCPSCMRFLACSSAFPVSLP